MGYKAHQRFCKVIITVSLMLLVTIFVTALTACEPVPKKLEMSQDEKLAELDGRLIELEFKHSELIMELCMSKMRRELQHHCKDFP